VGLAEESPDNGRTTPQHSVYPCLSLSACKSDTLGITPKALKRDHRHVPGIQVGGNVENRGIDLFRLAKEKGLQGITAKRKASTYQASRRSPDWAKIKAGLQQEFVIGGFTEGKGSRKHFGALLLGAYRNGKLHYFGHSGSGFSEKGLKETLDRLRPLFTTKSPLVTPPKIPEKVQWGKNELICEVAFAEWTEDEQMRQTTFLGLREDKDPKEVVRETKDEGKEAYNRH
jgi:bifunctional non-homologous end joining protein LigD